jgi:hypothetical protein
MEEKLKNLGDDQNSDIFSIFKIATKHKSKQREFRFSK